MADSIRVTMVFEIPVTPGEGGWVHCETVEDCAELAQAQYDGHEVSAVELIEWFEGGDPPVTVEAVTS